MKSINVLISILLVLSGCNLFDEDKPSDPPLPDTEYFLELYNNSKYQVTIERWNSGVMFDSYVLNMSSDTVVFDYYEEEPIQLLYYFGDSVRVSYNDVSIFHTREPNQAPSRSLFFPSSYEGGKVNDVQYIFSYEFTDVDYEEAVLLGG